MSEPDRCDKCSGTGWFDDNCSPLPESVVCPDCGGIDPSETPQAKLLRVRDEISAVLEREGCHVFHIASRGVRLNACDAKFMASTSIPLNPKQQEQGE